jgi:hypothetical protein
LDGPAQVTLVTKSRYVSRGIKKGLAEWQSNGWKWERFGRLVPVRDCDLWQRVERALQFHQVTCQAWQFETVESVEAAERVEPELANDIPVSHHQKRRRQRIDAPHPRVGSAERLRRRASRQVAHLSGTWRSLTQPDLLGAAM